MPFIVKTRSGMMAEQINQGLQQGLLAYMQGAKLAMQQKAITEQADFRQAQIDQGERGLQLREDTLAATEIWRGEQTVFSQQELDATVDYRDRTLAGQEEGRVIERERLDDARTAAERRADQQDTALSLQARGVAVDEAAADVKQKEREGAAAVQKQLITNIEDEYIADWLDTTAMSVDQIANDPVVKALRSLDSSVPGSGQAAAGVVANANENFGENFKGTFGQARALLERDHVDTPGAEVYLEQLAQAELIINWGDPESAKSSQGLIEAFESDMADRAAALAHLETPDMKQQIGKAAGRFRSEYMAGAGDPYGTISGIKTTDTGPRVAWAQSALVGTQRTIQDIRAQIASTPTIGLAQNAEGKQVPVISGLVDRDALLKNLESAMNVTGEAAVLTPGGLAAYLKSRGASPAQIAQITGGGATPHTARPTQSAPPTLAAVQQLEQSAMALPAIPQGGRPGTLGYRIGNALKAGSLDPTPGYVSGTLRRAGGSAHPVAPADAVLFLAQQSIGKRGGRPQTQAELTEQFIGYGWGKLLADKDASGGWVYNAEKYHALIGFATRAN